MRQGPYKVPATDGIAGVLRQLRIDADLTQAEAAARAGVTQAAVSYVESGKRDMRMTTVARLLGAYGQSWAALDACTLTANRTRPEKPT
jgi:transcriptional regulator with XRE-family HTH domain